MKKLENNPLLYGIVNCLLSAVGVVIVCFIISLVKKDESFSDVISGTYMLIILIGGSILSGISAYFKAKNKDKKEM